jgi:dolichyl-phosphate-mannose-protein mannosyltransferase
MATTITLPRPPATPRDPWGWQLALAGLFALVVGWHLGTPSKLYFDEIHYVPAARKLLLGLPANPEHPLLGKIAIAGAIRLLGDTPLVWRLPSAVMGVVGLVAFGRMLWWLGRWAGGAAAQQARVASLAGMVLLSTDFAWFIQSRIAMLDMVMAGFGMVALWMLAAAFGLPHGAAPGQRRWRLATAGLAMGLALGAKWSVLPVAVVACGGAVVLLAQAGGWRRPYDTSLAALPGISLFEALFWLGTVPMLAYWATFAPAFAYVQEPVSPFGLVGWHRYMLQLQGSVTQHHPYQSVWYQWIFNWRAIWYLYEHTDGAMRGIVLIGNPLTMLAGLGAMVWAALRWRRADSAVVTFFYWASLALWIFGHKPVQFYYHYLLPGTFLMALLGQVVASLWCSSERWRREAIGVLGLSVALFVWFWPIISAAALHKGTASFEDWMWLASWR